MRGIRKPIRNLILPAAILLPLLWVMAGCLYIPWFEHRLDSGPNVRALVGKADSDRPIRPYKVSRAQVVAMLGRANFISDDGNALGYEATTGVSSWVYPLCFAAEPADTKTYIVRLVFDENGMLNRYDWADESVYRDPDLLLSGMPAGPADSVLRKLNRSGPVLHRNGLRELQQPSGSWLP